MYFRGAEKDRQRAMMRVMTIVDKMEKEDGFEETLLQLCCIVAAYVHMNCLNPELFENAADDVRREVLRMLYEYDEGMQEATKWLTPNNVQ